MKKRITSICLIIALMVSNIGLTASAEEWITVPVSSLFGTSDAVATPSNATKSEASTPIATDSEAASATKSEASDKVFISVDPEEGEIPEYYVRASSSGKKFWKFENRYGSENYRNYGYIQGAVEFPEWYEVEEKGVGAKLSIDLDEEYYNLAPYLFENQEISDDDMDELLGLKNMSLSGDIEYLSITNWDNSKYNIVYINSNYYFFGSIVNDGDSGNSNAYWYNADSSGARNERVTQTKAFRIATLLASALSISSDRIFVYRSDSTAKLSKVDFVKNWKSNYPNNKLISASSDTAYSINSSSKIDSDALNAAQNDLLVFSVHNPADYSDINGDGTNGNTYLYSPSSGVIQSIEDTNDNTFYTVGILLDSSCNGRWTLHINEYWADDQDEGRTYFRYQEKYFDIQGIASTVTFQDWNGTVLSTQTISQGGNATAPSSPSRTGYTFSGWNQSFSNIQSDLTVTATYTPITYTVSYNGNGATGGSTSSSFYSYGTGKALTANGFTKTYYMFKNWNTKADGTGTTYSNGQSISNLTTTQGATITLYAQWTRSSSLVTYKNFDGSTLKTQMVAIGGAATPPSNPARTGHTFTGWDKSSSNIQDHTTITAQFSINSYKLSLNGNGGTVGGNSSKEENIVYQASFDQQLKDGKNQAVRTGYTFDGWYTQATGGSAYSYSGNVMPASTLTLYAHWLANTYDIYFDSNHMRWTGGILEKSAVFGTSIGTLPAPIIYGWNFLGWRTGKDGAGEKITEQSSVQPVDVTYYGSWESKKYQIQYVSEVNQPSGKSVQTFPAVQTYDAALGILPEPEETGYTFAGWFVGNERVTPETIFCPTNQADGYTYLASWQANAYHIRFLGNHDDLVPVIKEYNVTYNTKFGTLPEPEVRGYMFLGWFDKEGREITAENWVEAVDADYLAHWEANQYTISYDKNLYALEKNPESKTVTYGEAIGELPTCSADGYTFAGWHTEPEGGEKIEETTPVAIGDKIYYAHWINNTYVLKLITKNALNPVKEMLVVYDLVIGTLPGPELEDYVFRGWYLEPYSDTKATPSEAIKLQEGILLDTATPSEASRITKDTIYKVATASEAYAYFDLVYWEEEGNKNRRSGEDGLLDTEDDNFYFNGQDQTPGTTDDKQIHKGSDDEYGTGDDYYSYNGFLVYPGPNEVFGDADDYMDLEDGTNLRPGEADFWDNTGNLLVNNGYDEISGTRDDWIWENKEWYIIRKSGNDGIFFSMDDEIWWIGNDGIPGTEDDKLVQIGDIDFIDNGDGTNIRAGADGIWGTDDDELWWNGPDEIPGNEDDKLIHKGLDGQYGTSDDFIDNENGTNTRAGADGIWGTDDDELWQNGPDGIPGTEDDYQKNQSTATKTVRSLNSEDTDEDDGWSYDPDKNVWAYYYKKDQTIESSWAYLVYMGKKEWYYFDAEGNMKTGWYQDEEGKWYYLHEVSDGTKGHMYTGLKEINGKWYAFDKKDGHLIEEEE